MSAIYRLRCPAGCTWTQPDSSPVGNRCPRCFATWDLEDFTATLFSPVAVIEPADLAHTAIDVVSGYAREQLGEEEAEAWVAVLTTLVHLGLDVALRAALHHRLEARTIAFHDET